MKFFDVHCHLFTRDILSRQGSVALNFLNRFLSDTKRNEEEQESFGQLNRLLGFIDTSLADSAEETFAQMRKVYGDNFAVCPLCMDLRYGMIDADGKTNVEETTNEDHAAGKSEETASYWSFRRIVNFFSGNRFSALPNMFNDSFLSQIEEMEKLKARYPEHVYPFFPVDPRRNRDCDLMALIREKVGPGKPFVGIKLYPALGYSVTDPFLYGTENEKNGLFAYCEKYSIPVITHSGFSGYAALAKRVGIDGDIFHTESGRPVPVREIYPDGIVSFPIKEKMSDISMRGYLFNHPVLWEKVLNRYPNLYLDFAHLGGDKFIHRYIDESPTSGYYTAEILRFMAKYKNVYSDLSCFVDNAKKGYSLQALKTAIYDKAGYSVKKKFLYGSDYFIVKLKECSLESYYHRFCEVFGGEMRKIASVNPSRFLKYGLKPKRIWRRFLW